MVKQIQKTTQPLKDRQQAIIDSLLRFRYLTSSQIQTLLNHKGKENVRLWLNDLVIRGYIIQFYTKMIPEKPSEYCLTAKSIPYLREKGINTTLLRRIYGEKNKSQEFRKHNIFIATIYLSLQALVAKTGATLHFYTKVDVYGMEILELLPNNGNYVMLDRWESVEGYGQIGYAKR